MKNFKKIPYITVFTLFFTVQAYAAIPFDQWLDGVRAEARSKGISESIIQAALSDVRPIEKVVSLDRKQPEGKLTFQEYKTRVISQARIDEGRRLLREHRAELDRAAQKYGVPAQYIVALWGVETSYGKNTGGFSVINALATLAHDGRRSDFFRAELMTALKILDEGHINLANMKGSWAGAMGQNQFMPSSFKSFAVDGNGDGRRDIWTSLPDVFASTANYLSRSGWNEEERWGRKVNAPKGLSEKMMDLDVKYDLATWSKMGVTLPDGSPIPVADIKASLIQMDGPGSPAYLVYDNFRVILKWNRSKYFATSVGILADLIAQQDS